jgi:predicted short-subunit dehydrogenase-like oxidoreductase (DUF2520 family)
MKRAVNSRAKVRYGLFGAGAAARTVLAEMPCLRQELGPVAAATAKVAGRLANALKTGYAVRDLLALNVCEVILICAPDTGLQRAVELLQEAPLTWTEKVVLFCVSNVASRDFPYFEGQGASVGSFSAIEGMPKNYVIEGSRDAIREAKRLVKDVKGKALEVDQEGMQLFEAARTLSSSLFTPLVNGCVEWIRKSGLDSKEASRVAETMLAWTLRSYLHSGRRAWTGAARAQDWAAIERQYEAVKKVSVLEAEYFRSTAEHAFALYRSFPELARYLTKEEDL